jgi:pimeloyl-ACP methyl ester carboxylesterase
LPQSAHVRTSVLDIAYEQDGPAEALPVVLLHGYPYDPRAFDEVVPIINTAGHRTVVPYVRGYGGTRFLSPDTPRSGQQAAMGQDLLELLDALNIRQAVLAGFDWGARAACVVSALWPERVRALVTCAGYQVQDIAASEKPVEPEQERRFWYQYYFQTERGRRGLAQNRAELGRLLWKLWSPTWKFDEETYRRTAASFENDDFVDVVIHSYRHRMRNAPGDPRYAASDWQPCPRSAFRPWSFTVRSTTSTPRTNQKDISGSLPAIMNGESSRTSDTTRHKKLPANSPRRSWICSSDNVAI